MKTRPQVRQRSARCSWSMTRPAMSKPLASAAAIQPGRGGWMDRQGRAVHEESARGGSAAGSAVGQDESVAGSDAAERGLRGMDASRC
ncbi:hypothetical protein FLP41_03050 (plasmid) [Paracoccus marcusii]|uniref:hypothetical protein n=1 Tax=Paracoccus marcusii TaxID=59779 RepID=UPI002ED39764|nr:hypothetical protein FLP41_03050 [Paracoccus marcusii]